MCSSGRRDKTWLGICAATHNLRLTPSFNDRLMKDYMKKNVLNVHSAVEEARHLMWVELSPEPEDDRTLARMLGTMFMTGLALEVAVVCAC